MFIAAESLRNRHSVRSAMFGAVYISGGAKTISTLSRVYKHFTPPE
jgi:hypothetical protein